VAAFRTFRQEVEGPLLANMTEFGKTQYLDLDTFASLGYSLVLFPVTALRVAAFAVRRLFQEFRVTGSQRHLLTEMPIRDVLYRSSGYADAKANDKDLAAESRFSRVLAPHSPTISSAACVPFSWAPSSPTRGTPTRTTRVPSTQSWRVFPSRPRASRKPSPSSSPSAA